MADARILVVDDERSMREVLFSILKKEGYDVAVADGGEAAIETVRQEAFDAVITDVRMPKVDEIGRAHV